MGVWLEGWTGDNGRKLAGRARNQVLLTFTQEDLWLPGDLTTNKILIAGPNGYVPRYLSARVHCLTPGAREAIACDVGMITTNVSTNQRENFLAIEVAEYDTDKGNAWQPGVHLFAVGMTFKYTATSTTFATAIVDRNVKRFNIHMPHYLPGMTPEDPPMVGMFGLAAAAQSVSGTQAQQKRRRIKGT